MLWPFLCTLLASTTMLVQLTSFALLSDVDLIVVKASSESRTMPTNFRYGPDGSIPIVTHGSTWSQQLQSYVSFGEYHEQPPASLPDGVVDTGLTLRAFLPVRDQQTRSMVASWDGIATVLDARAVCIRPTLLQPRVHYADESIALETGFLIDLDDPPSLGLEGIEYANSTCTFEGCPEASACMIPLADLSNNGSINRDSTDSWRLAMCQPAGDTLFILQSQFQIPGQNTRSGGSGPNYSFGNAYMVINVSSGSATEWAQAIPGEDPNLGLFRGSGTTPLGYGVHGQNNEWYDLIYSEDARLNLSVSVCYTAFDTADLRVSIESSSNHSDTVPTWNERMKVFDYSDIRRQFGQEVDGTVTYSNDSKARNILSLQKRESWVPEPDFGDCVAPKNRVTQTSWITDYANMAGSLQSNVFDYYAGYNKTRFLWKGYQLTDLWNGQMGYDYADASLIELIQEILQAGGSLSFAMQSIVTSLSQLAYYQQLQQLNDDSPVTFSSYSIASAPVRQRGIIAVSVVLGVHILIVFCAILPSFLMQTKVSALGNAWQAVAQLIGSKTKPILDKAPLATDEEAEDEVKLRVGRKQKLKNHELVGIRLVEEGDAVVVMASDDRAGESVPTMTSTKAGQNHEDEQTRTQQEEETLLQPEEQAVPPSVS